ncbi:MAG TPA: serine protease [Methylorubrum populi]|uniref:Serine protease n=1 Tax=Methylorubrum populi TaxID=223967 RepID=A0A921DYU7_9HYPH|nr:serine protease [Methylorubrum populi]
MYKKFLLTLVILLSAHQASEADDAGLSPAKVKTLGEIAASIQDTMAQKSLNKEEEAKKSLNISRLIGQADSLLLEIKAIYGSDNRKEFKDGAPIEKQAADSVAAFMESTSLIAEDGGKNFRINGSETRFCTPEQAANAGKPPEAFFDQKAAAYCTGFKVGKDLIATAGHCIKSKSDCAQAKIVFKFRVENDSIFTSKVSADDVFQCKEMVDGDIGQNGSDWRIIRVDREMSKQPTVKLRASGAVPINAPLTVIGHPTGLPAKIAPGATVREIKEKFFVTNSDTYAGNSGSAVFNSSELGKGNLLVEGILVRGEADFEVVNNGECRVSKRCPLDGCRGEDVTHASVFASKAR